MCGWKDKVEVWLGGHCGWGQDWGPESSVRVLAVQFSLRQPCSLGSCFVLRVLRVASVGRLELGHRVCPGLCRRLASSIGRGLSGGASVTFSVNQGCYKDPIQ